MMPPSEIIQSLPCNVFFSHSLITYAVNRKLLVYISCFPKITASHALKITHKLRKLVGLGTHVIIECEICKSHTRPAVCALKTQKQ